jgi:hypothetical protein
MKKLILVALLSLQSCGLFSIDSNPAIQVKKAQTEVFLTVVDNFTEIIKKSQGISEAQRELILLKISEAVRTYEKDEFVQLEFLKSIDNENYEAAVISEITALFLKLKDKYQW